MKKINLMVIAVLFIAGFTFNSCKKENVVATQAEDASMAVINAQRGGGTTNNAIQIQNNAFQPRVLSTVAGNTVTWYNDDAVVHTVIANDESFNSGDIQPGGSFSMVITTPGWVEYHDAYTPNMSGVLQVAGIK